MIKDGQCKFGHTCSFYHSEEDRRRLIDPLPDLPCGALLPPVPTLKNKILKEEKRYRPKRM